MAKNRPQVAATPIYGPDHYSRTMAVAVMARSNPVSASSRGPGTIRERQNTDAWLPIRQALRGLTGAIRNASVKNLPASAELPSTSARVDGVYPAFPTSVFERL